MSKKLERRESKFSREILYTLEAFGERESGHLLKMHRSTRLLGKSGALL